MVRGKVKSFDDKIRECNHKNLYPDYFVFISCGTSYCNGSEVHCKECGAFISTCLCGANNGISGWPWFRVLKRQRKSLELKK